MSECEVTKNPCGSDTWEVTTPCKCRACQAWLMEHIAELEADKATLRALLSEALGGLECDSSEERCKIYTTIVDEKMGFGFDSEADDAV